MGSKLIRALAPLGQVHATNRDELDLADPDPWLEKLSQLVPDGDVPLEAIHEWVRQLLLRGRIDEARSALEGRTDRRSRALAGWAAFVAGEPAPSPTRACGDTAPREQTGCCAHAAGAWPGTRCT